MVLPLTLHAYLAYAISFFYVWISVLRVVSVCRIYCTRIRSFNRRPKFPSFAAYQRDAWFRADFEIRKELQLEHELETTFEESPPQVSGLYLYPRGLCEKARWRNLLLCKLRLNPVLQYNRLGSSC